LHCSIPVALDRAVVYQTLRDNGALRAFALSQCKT
jgi:hypothetical protein